MGLLTSKEEKKIQERTRKYKIKEQHEKILEILFFIKSIIVKRVDQTDSYEVKRKAGYLYSIDFKYFVSDYYIDKILREFYDEGIAYKSTECTPTNYGGNSFIINYPITTYVFSRSKNELKTK